MDTIDTPEQKFAIVEIMGHDRIAGRLSEVSIAGVPLICIDAPDLPWTPDIAATEEQWGQQGSDARPGYRRMFGGSAIFSITICDETAAFADEMRRRPRRQSMYAPRLIAASVEAPHDPFSFDDDDDDTNEDESE